MKFLGILFFLVPTVVFAQSPIIKNSTVICGALTCRVYSLEKASISGTVVRITSCVIDQSKVCDIEIRRDITHGSIAEAIAQYDEYVSQDSGD